MPEQFIVWYGKVIEDKKDGLLVDYPFFGGVGNTKEEADQKARILVNDKSKQATVIPQVFKINGGDPFTKSMKLAAKKFERMAHEMYECEALYEKRRSR